MRVGSVSNRGSSTPAGFEHRQSRGPLYRERGSLPTWPSSHLQIRSATYRHNYIARCDFLCDVSPSAYYAPKFTGNVLSGVGDIQRPQIETPQTAHLPYDSLFNIELPTPVEYESYERRRWTGPELAVGAMPAGWFSSS
jgi:hypothetical protein